MIEQVAKSDPYELLLGRGTYEIFAAHGRTTRADREPAQQHPQARRLENPEEGGVEQLRPYQRRVAEYVAELKSQDGPEIQVHGSPGLIQTLLGHALIDSTGSGYSPWWSVPANGSSVTASSPAR